MSAAHRNSRFSPSSPASLSGRTARPAAREGRHRAREAALQMLYQWEVGRGEIEDVVRTFWTLGRSGAADGEQTAPSSAEDGADSEEAGAALRGRPSSELHDFAVSLARGTVARLGEIDPLIAETAEHWRFSRLAVIDRLILRLAIYEFLQGETPPNVAIDEAIRLAKTFSTDDSVKFVNGVLDGIKRKLADH